jgi:SAM-dependent methyltransferase
MMSVASRIRRLLPNPPSTTYNFRHMSRDLRSVVPENGVIFDIGSKDARGGYILGGAPSGTRLVCVDILDRPGVDLVADAENLHMVESNSVDLVLAFNVLEHIRHPDRAIAEFERILKPGGFIWVDVPFMYPFHGDPDDYYRFSDHGLAIACERFEKIECKFLRGPASCMAEFFVQFVAVLFCFNSRRLHGAIEYLARWSFSWIKYLDYFIGHFDAARTIHAGTTFVGRKRAPAASSAT